MTDGKKTNGATAQEREVAEARERDAAAADAATDRDQAPDNDNAPEAPAGDDRAAEITALEEENAALKERLLRAVAETENLRKRAEREAAEARLYAATAFARDMLTVADNLGRAIAAVPDEMRESADETLKTLLSGVEMTEREMNNVFERHGIQRFDPEGERFDPNFHQAMFEVENPDVPSSTVVQVMQTGYRIGERVLRPAMVGVSKGGPKPAPAKAPETSQDKAE
ncbi:nucleotide exchange factor GrpE [Kaustia mangrovi]|uniref:Protein GrpE n=1 Tax=Kaustia mangrovi TaxID=2593653 RepID=A0A7S8HC74_9HYPH|nr:nucleotide exchange factor GrpE [Kaustia mangrovi]QPC43407.1 nucleotide exchange factor GrpE [Kaustia mangrovi]